MAVPASDATLPALPEERSLQSNTYFVCGQCSPASSSSGAFPRRRTRQQKKSSLKRTRDSQGKPGRLQVSVCKYDMRPSKAGQWQTRYADAKRADSAFTSSF